MPPHPHPIPCPTLPLIPRVLPALGIETLYKSVWLCPFQSRGQGCGLPQVESSLWPHTPFCAPPTPHPFIVNSHFCTGFEPGDVGSHFFSLCWHLRPLEAWPTSRCDLGKSQGVFPHLPPMLKMSGLSALALEGWDARIPWQGTGRGVERCSVK